MKEKVSTKLNFSWRLRQLMENHQINQKQLAKEIDVAQGSISGWLKGRIPTSEKVRRIAQFFEITEEWLLCLDSETQLKEAVRYADIHENKPDVSEKEIAENQVGVFEYKYNAEKARADKLAIENDQLKKQLRQLKAHILKIVSKLEWVK